MVPDPDQTGGAEGPEDPGRPEDARQPPSLTEVRDEVAREVLRIYEESYGTGAANAETLVGENWVIVVLDGLQLLPNESSSPDGQADTVMEVRTRYQHAIRSSFSAAVERAMVRQHLALVHRGNGHRRPRDP